MSMESTCSARFLSASTDETEYYLYPKRIKIESNPKSVEKEEQQKLEASIHHVSRHQTSPREPKYFSERQTNQSLEKQSCDTARKTYIREFFRFQACSNDRLPCRVSENKLSTKRLSPENEFQNPAGDVSLNVHGQPLETKSFAVWSAANTCKRPQVLNAPEVQWNNNVEQSDNRNGDNELNQNPSVTPLNRSLFQMELLGRKSVSDKKWEQYQLLQIPFLCGTSSVFSDTNHEKRNFLKKTCSMQDKNCSSSDETAAEIDNKEKNNSSHITPILKPFKSTQLLEIPNFRLPRLSNKINSKTLSTDLKETDWDNFKGQPSLMQSEQICGMQKMSEIGKQRLQNDKSSVKISTVGSELKEKNCPSTSKQERSALTEGGKVSVTYCRGNSTDVESYQVFAENDFRDKMMENSDADDDQESKIHFYISAKNIQNKKYVSWDDLLKRMGRKSSNENMGTFRVQMSISVITEALEKTKLDVPFGAHHSDSDTSLYEAESKLSTKEILDSKRYLTQSIIFESNCPRIIVQDFLDKKVSCNTFRGKEMFKLKFSFQNMLGWVRTWPESLDKDTALCQDSSVTHWLHFHEKLNGQCDAQELVKSNANRNHNSKIYICLLAVISKDLKVELLKTILPSFFSSIDTLLPTKGKLMQVEKHPLCGTKQDELNTCTDNTLRQNTEFLKESKTYPGLLSSKFLESIGFDLHNECQRRHFSRSLGEESNFLKRGTLFHNQKSGLYRRRHVRKHHLLSRGTEGFSLYLRSLSHKNDMKKQILVAKCLILLQGTFDHSSLDKMYCSNITKIQYLMGANLRSWSYFPAHSQLKFGKVNSKCTNQEISVTTVKQERRKPSKMFNSYFLRERFKTFPFILRENEIQKTTRYRNCITSTNEVTHTMKKYLDTSSYVNANKKECVKSEELQINSYDLLSKKSFSIFDTYEKIPLFTDSEELDEIPVANQDNSGRKKLSEENAFTSSKEGHILSAKSNDVIILSEQTKTTMEKCNFLLLEDSQTNQLEYCKRIDTRSLHLANKKEKIEDQNTLHFENLLSSFSDVYHSVTLPLDSSSLVGEDRVVSEDGHCRSSSSADNQKQTEKPQATVQYPSATRPTVTDTCLQLQAEEEVQFSSQEHTQKNKAVSLEPATLKQHLEYVKEQEEINDEQMHVTNESQCETVMNDLIMSHSEEESKTFIAAEEKLKMHLSVTNNGCLEDVEDKYLPLENKITCELELKRKFDLVLEELHMFHEISKGSENSLSSLETNSQNNYYELNNSEGIDENVASVSQEEVCISSPIHGTEEMQNITDSNESSLNEKMPNENEDQKVSKEYCISRLSSEKLLHSPVAEGNFDAAYKKPYAWDPAFLPCTLLKEGNYNLPEEGDDVLISSLQGHGLPFFHRYFLQREVLRVQPLKTCKGPIRIGLSRKARPKQLHPYLK